MAFEPRSNHGGLAVRDESQLGCPGTDLADGAFTFRTVCVDLGDCASTITRKVGSFTPDCFSLTKASGEVSKFVFDALILSITNDSEKPDRTKVITPSFVRTDPSAAIAMLDKPLPMIRRLKVYCGGEHPHTAQSPENLKIG